MANENLRSNDRVLSGSTIHINGKVYQFYEGVNIIGRNKEAVVNVKDIKVSQIHAVIITITNGEHYISDFNSSNGTLLGDLRLTPFNLYKLKDGDSVGFADIQGVYRVGCSSNYYSQYTQSTQSTVLYGANTQIMNDVSHNKDQDSVESMNGHRDLQGCDEDLDIQDPDIHKSNSPKVENDLEGNLHEMDTQIVTESQLYKDMAGRPNSYHDRESIEMHEAPTQVFPPTSTWKVSDKFPEITNYSNKFNEEAPTITEAGVESPSLENTDKTDVLDVGPPEDDVNVEVTSHANVPSHEEEGSIRRSDGVIEDTMYEPTSSNDSEDFLMMQRAQEVEESLQDSQLHVSQLKHKKRNILDSQEDDDSVECSAESVFIRQPMRNRNVSKPVIEDSQEVFEPPGDDEGLPDLMTKPAPEQGSLDDTQVISELPEDDDLPQVSEPAPVQGDLDDTQKIFRPHKDGEAASVEDGLDDTQVISEFQDGDSPTSQPKTYMKGVKVIGSDSETDAEEDLEPNKQPSDFQNEIPETEEDLNDTDVIPATQDLIAAQDLILAKYNFDKKPVESDKPTPTSRLECSEDSFRLGLTQLMNDSDKSKRDSGEHYKSTTQQFMDGVANCHQSTQGQRELTMEADVNTIEDSECTQVNPEDDIYMLTTQKVNDEGIQGDGPRKESSEDPNKGIHNESDTIYIESTQRLDDDVFVKPLPKDRSSGGNMSHKEDDVYLAPTQKLVPKRDLNKAGDHLDVPDESIYLQPTQKLFFNDTKSSTLVLDTKEDEERCDLDTDLDKTRIVECLSENVETQLEVAFPSQNVKLTDATDERPANPLVSLLDQDTSASELPISPQKTPKQSLRKFSLRTKKAAADDNLDDDEEEVSAISKEGINSETNELLKTDMDDDSSREKENDNTVINKVQKSDEVQIYKKQENVKETVSTRGRHKTEKSEKEEKQSNFKESDARETRRRNIRGRSKQKEDLETKKSDTKSAKDAGKIKQSKRKILADVDDVEEADGPPAKVMKSSESEAEDNTASLRRQTRKNKDSHLPKVILSKMASSRNTDSVASASTSSAGNTKAVAGARASRRLSKSTSDDSVIEEASTRGTRRGKRMQVEKKSETVGAVKPKEKSKKTKQEEPTRQSLYNLDIYENDLLNDETEDTSAASDEPMSIKSDTSEERAVSSDAPRRGKRGKAEEKKTTTDVSKDSKQGKTREKRTASGASTDTKNEKEETTSAVPEVEKSTASTRRKRPHITIELDETPAACSTPKSRRTIHVDTTMKPPEKAKRVSKASVASRDAQMDKEEEKEETSEVPEVKKGTAGTRRVRTVLTVETPASCSTPRSKRTAAHVDTVPVTPERTKRVSKPKVAFTLMESPELESAVRQMGGSVVDTIESCTVLVTEKIKRTQKLLTAVGLAKPICSPRWIRDSKKAGKFLDTSDYILSDSDAEKKWSFSLSESLHRSTNKRLLEGYTFQLVVNNAADVLKGAIEACGGKCVGKVPQKNAQQNFYIVSSPESKTKYSKIKKQHGVAVIAAEAIFDGVLRQELAFEKHSLD